MENLKQKVYSFIYNIEIKSIYKRKIRWKLILLIAAVLIGLSSLWYTRLLVKKISDEERKKVELWANATKQLAHQNEGDGDVTFLFDVIKNNETVPVILTDENKNIITFRNLDSIKALDPEYLKAQLEVMKRHNNPIDIELLQGQKNYIFYKDSFLLTQLKYFPYVQLGIISLFIMVSYLAFSISRRAEQNQVWVGLSKETAHQLGTPISSLLAWIEYLKANHKDDKNILEFEKDVKRLELITERFSKIGSAPVLLQENIVEALENSVKYIKNRSPETVKFDIKYKEGQIIIAKINKPLFDWVVENLCKNAIDAMSGEGSILFSISSENDFINIDVTDSGKGMHRSKFKTIFKPGYTTKARGWGLGLSLSKRIIENYHAGQIFVKDSEINKGTTFSIVLHK